MKRWLGVVVAAALVALGVVAPGQADPPARPGASPAKTVTLVTGDKVRIAPRGDSWDLRVQPRFGRPVAFSQYVSKDHAYVIPSDAARLVTKGVVDKRLFDVAGLVEQGYDDASRTSLPLITTHQSPAGATVTRRLARTGLTAVVAPKATTATLWQRLREGGTRVWLDAKVEPVLDESVPKVGAPSAWQAGYTGRGVNVAVLDTGIDANHPDLGGKVAGSRDFTGEGVHDRNGHGTHIASTIAGSGAASEGRFKGVAPDAKLLVGKVLGEQGGLESWVIAGMEWAADEGARVANLSLGTYLPADQSNPVAQAVNRLSRQTRTLYVVAAGNLGDSDQTITSPGSAAAALTVGSVSKSDVLSGFSSRGPVLDDHRVKPDLVAPGEAIVAARAKDTLDEYAVGEHYARLDGTSMATPHVSGAAAILTQRHPEWDGEDVKAALTASAQPVAGATAYGQGAGRLDVARAVRQDVRTDIATVDLGILRWPHVDDGSGTKTVTYRNDGDAPVTLALAISATGADGEPVPTGTVGLATQSVTVPAHGTARATVSYDLKKARVGQFGGWLTATSADGAVRLRTPLGGYLEPERYDVELGLRDGLGRSGTDNVVVLAGPNGDLYGGIDGDVVRVPPGRYVVNAVVTTPRADEAEPTVAYLAQPRFDVRRDTSIALDARQSVPVRWRLDKPGARPSHLTVGDSVPGHGGFLLGVAENYDDVRVGRSGEPADDYEFYVRARHTATDAFLQAVGPERFGVDVWWAPDSSRLPGRHRFSLVDGGGGKAADIARVDVRGKAVLVAPESDHDLTETMAAVHDGGGSAIVVWIRPGVSLYTSEDRRVPTVYTTRIEAGRLAELAKGGDATVELRGLLNSPYVYDLSFPTVGQPPSDLSFRVRDRQLAAVKASYVAPSEVPSSGYPYPWQLDPDLPIAGWCCGGAALPLRRTEYYTPGTWQFEWNWLAWDGTEPGMSGHRGVGEPVRLRAGQRTSITWGGPVYGPGFPVSPAELASGVSRSGDEVVVDLPLLADGAGHYDWPAVDQSRDGDVGATRLYRNGALVGTSDIAGFGTFSTPAGAADLRLETDLRRTADWWPTSTRVSATWTMRSKGDGVLPVLAIRYQPAADLAGRVRGGLPYLLPVTVRWQQGAPVTKVTKLAVRVSYDDGKTWRTAPLVRVGDGWRAVLTHPSRGFVSLRAQAEDANGNTVDQTIIRAYRLR